jgi:hypothetical protein
LGQRQQKYLISAVSPPPVGGGRGISKSGCFFPPAPVLAARAGKDNDKDKDGHIIIKEQGDAAEDEERTASFDHHASAMRQWKVPLLVAAGHDGQQRQGFWLLTAWMGTNPSTMATSTNTSTVAAPAATMTVLAPAATMRE